jgi:hypothetical protein
MTHTRWSAAPSWSSFRYPVGSRRISSVLVHLPPILDTVTRKHCRCRSWPVATGQAAWRTVSTQTITMSTALSAGRRRRRDAARLHSAQVVVPYKQEVGGSSPPAPTRKPWSEHLSTDAVGFRRTWHPRIRSWSPLVMFATVTTLGGDGDGWRGFGLTFRQEVALSERRPADSRTSERGGRLDDGWGRGWMRCGAASALRCPCRYTYKGYECVCSCA